MLPTLAVKKKKIEFCCLQDAAGSQSALTLSNVSGIFHILIVGLVLSMITSSVEYIVQSHLKQKTIQNVCISHSIPPTRLAILLLLPLLS